MEVSCLVSRAAYVSDKSEKWPYMLGLLIGVPLLPTFIALPRPHKARRQTRAMLRPLDLSRLQRRRIFRGIFFPSSCAAGSYPPLL